MLRGCWFEVLGDKWYPILEVEHSLIETAHIDWLEKVICLTTKYSGTVEPLYNGQAGSTQILSIVHSRRFILDQTGVNS